MILLLKRAAAVLVACPLVVSTAYAAGYDFNDHGARALGMGGAHAGLPDDGTAIYYNPAGLTAIKERLTLQLDSALIWESASFTRAPEGSTVFPKVENDSGMFYSPFLAVTYKATPRLAFALGVHGPPSNGKLEYPDPSGATVTKASFDQAAPQRYMLIERDVLVAYPGLAGAYAVTDWLSLGVNVQLVYMKPEFTQDIVSSETTVDQRVQVKSSGVGAVTGILGATVRLVEGLHLGASWRPRFETSTKGTIKVRPYLDIPFEQVGEDIDFKVPFPDVIRVGLDWRSGLVHLATDFVYETYSNVDHLTIQEREDIIEFISISKDNSTLMADGTKEILEHFGKILKDLGTKVDNPMIQLNY